MKKDSCVSASAQAEIVSRRTIKPPAHLSKLREQLGPAVLIPIRFGTKIPSIKGWSRLQIADTQNAAYGAKLAASNIGVSLGAPSGGLCTIDVDHDDFLPALLSSNPSFANTLQSRGARGCNFWLRMIGEYPQATVKLETTGGHPWGEFRSTGGQTVIYGKHPKGPDYKRNDRQPLEIPFDSIVWPDCVEMPDFTQLQNGKVVQKRQRCTEDTEVSEGTDGTKGTEVIVEKGESLFLTQIKTVNDAIRAALPTGVHTSHYQLFTLARAVKSLEIDQGEFTAAHLGEVFQMWFTHPQTVPCLKKGAEMGDQYFSEFLHAYKLAKYPLGSHRVAQAFEIAKASPLPREADHFTGPKLKLLVGLCWQLQIMAGADPFYLSARTVQSLFQQDTHSTAATWLSSLVVLKVLEVAEAGTTRRATRYRYITKNLTANHLPKRTLA